MQVEKIIPITESDKGLSNSYTGRLIDYTNPNMDMLNLDDIATSLSNVCRFGGHLNEHYSVAQHTLLVWHLAPDELKRTALLHDAAEAYLGDVIKPVKVLLGDAYTKLERPFEELIFKKYGVDIISLKEIKPYDQEALIIENNYFRFGKLDFISKFYDINEILPFGTPRVQLLSLLKSEFLQAELNYHSIDINQ